MDRGSPDPLDDPVEGPKLMEENIRKAEEEKYRKYRSLDREHTRWGVVAAVFMLLATIALIICIAVSVKHDNEETAFLAAGTLLGLFYLFTIRICDGLYELKQGLPHPPEDQKPAP
ncbi:MAG: hypothetical protein PHI63_01495 [Patescibacteria group bacterium]|nr:hypothetical protein [Patescibacteria group bacterium]